MGKQSIQVKAGIEGLICTRGHKQHLDQGSKGEREQRRKGAKKKGSRRERGGRGKIGDIMKACGWNTR